jgi:RNA polymerase sigma factor (sigma-70 family)
MTTVDAVRREIEAVWQIEAARLIAGLARSVGDVGLAEDLAQEALVAALEQWPETGVPRNPAAWLMAVGKRRGVDRIRRDRTLDLKLATLAASADDDANEPTAVKDDLLRLIFIACHPVLSPDSRVALTLRLLGGLSTDEIARAFLVQESTVARRISRAKRSLTAARIPFELPPEHDRRQRLASVLEVIYLIFNEGYAATAGSSWTRPRLCDDAQRLGRVLAELLPDESEVHGLVAVMELQASRLRARRGPGGRPVLLPDQDRTRWDHLLIRLGLTALDRAAATGSGLGPYGLQAAIAARHATARTYEDTDWEGIVVLYDALLALTPSAVIELNRAVAMGKAKGPQAGLDALAQLMEEPALDTYHLLPAVRADLLAQLGRVDDARAELDRAIRLATNDAEIEMLRARADALTQRV